MDAGVTIPGKPPKCARRDFNFKEGKALLKRHADSTRLSHQETILACITRGVGNILQCLQWKISIFAECIQTRLKS